MDLGHWALDAVLQDVDAGSQHLPETTRESTEHGPTAQTRGQVMNSHDCNSYYSKGSERVGQEDRREGPEGAQEGLIGDRLPVRTEERLFLGVV